MQEDYREFEAKTVDEAIVAAMKAFRLDFENLDIQVVSEGSKGLFGFMGTKLAKILARPASKGEAPAAPVREEAPAREPVREPRREHVREHPRERMREERPASRPEPEEAPQAVQASPEVMEQARAVTVDILSLMHMEAEVKIRQDNVIEVVGDGSGLLIGKHGATIDSLQFIVNRILNKNREEPVYITIDTEGYRKRHVDHLRSMALKMGQKVRRTGQSVSLEKMNPYDRRIIHLALKNDSRVNTKSIGEGIYKKVVILPRKASR